MTDGSLSLGLIDPEVHRVMQYKLNFPPYFGI